MLQRCGCSSPIVAASMDAFYEILHTRITNGRVVRGAQVFDEFGDCLIVHIVLLFL